MNRDRKYYLWLKTGGLFFARSPHHRDADFM